MKTPTDIKTKPMTDEKPTTVVNPEAKPNCAPVPGSVAEVREDVFFIEDGSGLGKLANSRMSAHQWLDAMLDGLKAGDGTGDTDFMEDVKFEYRAMTKAEVDALPEI